MFLKGIDTSFRQFMYRSLTEVSYQFLVINEVHLQYKLKHMWKKIKLLKGSRVFNP
jgi:hypothetical protein